MKDDTRDDILNQNGADLPLGILGNNAANSLTPRPRAQADVAEEDILNQNGTGNTGSGGDSDDDGGWHGDAPDPSNA